MNQTLISIMDMVREVKHNAQIKVSRNFTDFLADRIVQACTEQNLLSAMERLSALVNAETGNFSPAVIPPFVSACSAPDADAVLRWLRQYPRVAAMLTMLNKIEYADTIKTIDITVSEADSGTALPPGSFQIPITITCLSPLAHGADTKAGNATLFRRMQVLTTTGSVLSLPYYAGNAVRGQIRDLLADDFLQALGLIPRRDNPPVALWFFHALYAGGALEENSAAEKALKKELGGHGAVRAEGVHMFRDTLPGLSLLGCALGNRVLCGRAKFGDFRPACKQWSNGEVEVGKLFEWLYLIRREDHENHEEHSGMIANTECLRSGTVLYGGLDVDHHASQLERSALGRGIKLLSERGYLGANNNRGIGRVTITAENIPDPTIYEEYLRANKDAILDYLNRLGAAKCTLLS